jgi:hypothetical protein
VLLAFSWGTFWFWVAASVVAGLIVADGAGGRAGPRLILRLTLHQTPSPHTRGGR